MATIAANVAESLIGINATDTTIQAHCEAEVISWIDDQIRSFRWDFSRVEATASLASGATYIALASDYWKMNTVKLKDADGNYTAIEVIEREKFDRLTDPTATGTPFVAAVLGSNLYFYYVPDKAFTVYYDYWKTAGTLTNASTSDFPDRIIKQVAKIAGLNYDRLDTTTEEMKLRDMVAQFRRNMKDDGIGGSQVEMDKDTYQSPPLNYY